MVRLYTAAAATVMSLVKEKKKKNRRIKIYIILGQRTFRKCYDMRVRRIIRVQYVCRTFLPDLLNIFQQMLFRNNRIFIFVFYALLPVYKYMWYT